MPIPDLPLEVVSLISSLLAEPFYPPSDLSACSSSSSKLTGSLDPSPPPLQTICNLISSVSKASPRLLEASRPWLWENVDVRSGRGWLAVVNALTEEVIEDIPIADEKISSPIEGQLTPVSPESLPASDAHVQPNAVPGGTTQYISPPSPITYPYPRSTPQGMSITIPPSYYYSPPQPLRTDLLLTPPDTRNSSPNSNSASPPSVTTARLRGRSRSRRRNVGFDTEGISAVLSRSRSTSINTGRPGSADSWGRPPPIGRRSSLSLTRTRADLEDETDENEGDEDGQEDLDEEEDEVMPLTSPRPQLLIPPVPEEERMNLNPELLPPPGPYIRHLSFVNFRTIGSRRTQDEAVRGRYVTAGRLEGVIKVGIHSSDLESG